MFDVPRKHSLAFFRPGKLAFFVTHPKQKKPNERQFKSLENKSLEALKKIEPKARLRFGRIYSLPSVPEPDHCYASKLIDQKRPKITPRDESSLLFANIQGEDNPIKFFQLARGLQEELLKMQAMDGLTLESISPSWLVSGGPEGSGTGGPGSWPQAYRGAPYRAPYQFINLPDVVLNSQQGKGVDVVILDTAPSRWSLQLAYRLYKDSHPLIHSLLRPNGPLRVYPAPFLERFRLMDLRALGHDYRMTDHGLFAAGIIHTIAPCARIHLVEVLNPYGVGDFESIIRGLNFALNRDFVDKNEAGYEEKSFVVNCSLTLNLPLVEGHRYTKPIDHSNCFADLFTDLDRQLEEVILQAGQDGEWVKRQRLALEQPCDLIYAQNSRVIAAAGNDRRPGQNVVPQARYPAALDSVQGVGALPKIPLEVNGQRKTSSYSNRADIPEKIGIATLGGEAGEEQGVLGLYLGEFPGGEANRTKWAWWAGTSFAAPILSGVTAAVLSNTPNGIMQETIDNMYLTEGIIGDNAVEGGQDILDVIQGYPL